MNATYLIPVCNLAELNARIEKLNKRAAKLGCEPITITSKVDHVRYQARQLTVDGQINLVWMKSIEKKDPSTLPATAFLANAFEPTGEVMEWFAVEITGESPSYNGWTFLATLEPVQTEDGTENLMQCVPGATIPHEFKNKVGVCDHCKQNRKQNQTFVIKHEVDGFKCVGRQCIKDFLHLNHDPHNLAAAAEMLAELSGLCEAAEDCDWMEGGCSRGERCWDMNVFLALTASRIAKKGWVSRTTAREEYNKEATADVVLSILTPPSGKFASEKEKRDHENLVAEHTPDEKNKQDAETAIEWCKTISQKEMEDSNYLANINTASRMGYVTRKTAGIVASIMVAWFKANEREINRQKLAARPASKHVGVVGKRIELTVKCEKVIAKEGNYGTTGIHKLTTEDGSDVTWFATSAEWLEEGKTYKVKASVKSHDEYQGRPQTVVQRLKIMVEVA